MTRGSSGAMRTIARRSALRVSSAASPDHTLPRAAPTPRLAGCGVWQCIISTGMVAAAARPIEPSSSAAWMWRSGSSWLISLSTGRASGGAIRRRAATAAIRRSAPVRVASSQAAGAPAAASSPYSAAARSAAIFWSSVPSWQTASSLFTAAAAPPAAGADDLPTAPPVLGSLRAGGLALAASASTARTAAVRAFCTVPLVSSDSTRFISARAGTASAALLPSTVAAFQRTGAASLDNCSSQAFSGLPSITGSSAAPADPTAQTTARHTVPTRIARACIALPPQMGKPTDDEWGI